MHPGYGFLSENADFVDSCEKAGVAFLGPTGATMRMFSRKHTAREFAQNANVPVLPGGPFSPDPPLPGLRAAFFGKLSRKKPAAWSAPERRQR